MDAFRPHRRPLTIHPSFLSAAQGLTCEQCGQLLYLAPRTLRAWHYLDRLETIGLAPLGRPLLRSPLCSPAWDESKQATTGVGVPTPATVMSVTVDRGRGWYSDPGRVMVETQTQQTFSTEQVGSRIGR
jgi:hypothetical protein